MPQTKVVVIRVVKRNAFNGAMTLPLFSRLRHKGNVAPRCDTIEYGFPPYIPGALLAGPYRYGQHPYVPVCRGGGRTGTHIGLLVSPTATPHRCPYQPVPVLAPAPRVRPHRPQAHAVTGGGGRSPAGVCATWLRQTKLKTSLLIWHSSTAIKKARRTAHPNGIVWGARRRACLFFICVRTWPSPGHTITRRVRLTRAIVAAANKHRLINLLGQHCAGHHCRSPQTTAGAALGGYDGLVGAAVLGEWGVGGAPGTRDFWRAAFFD